MSVFWQRADELSELVKRLTGIEIQRGDIDWMDKIIDAFLMLEKRASVTPGSD